MSKINYEIVKEIGVLSTSAKGWTKELNLISWMAGRRSMICVIGCSRC